MTQILALDTSGTCCSVALIRQTSPSSMDSEVLAQVYSAPREHTQRILPMIDALLAEAELSLNRLDGLAFGRGPGSFTGLRIALSVVQGLAYGADIPVIPVSTLKALAQQAQRRQWATEGDTLLTSLDARMNEVYIGAYHLNPCGVPSLSTPEQVLAPEEAVTAWQATLVLSQPQIKVVGDGWNLNGLQVPAQRQGLVICQEAESIHATPLAEDIAPLALDAFLKGDVVEAMKAEPVYLRNEVTWKKRQRIRQLSTQSD